MPDLRFRVAQIAPIPHAATPQLAFTLDIDNAPVDEPIHSIQLQCQLRLDPTKRRYTPEEQVRLRDLFGVPERWGQTVRATLWTHAQVMVPAFMGCVTVEMQVPCTFDFNVAVTKYFAGLDDGEVPVLLLFSGTAFYEGDGGHLQVAPIPWTKEATCRVPVAVWQEMMDHYYPNSAWLNLRRDVFDRLYRYKVAHGLPTWEATLERLLPDGDA